MRKLGKLKEFVEWLQGEDSTPDSNSVSPLIKIKVFNKRLERQIKKMEIKEKMAKKKAIKAREEGDIAGSRLHMRSSLQYRKWAFSTQKFKNQMDNVQFRLEQAKVMGDFTSVAQDITTALKGLEMEVKVPQIQGMLQELNLGFGKMDAIFEETSEQLEMSQDSSPTGVSENEVDDALAAVDAEMAMDTGLELPSVPSMESPDKKLESLEDEIKKLKESRKL